MLGDLFFEISLLLLMVTTTAVMIFGFCIVIAPEKMERIVAPLNHWISTDVALDRLNQPHRLERFFYRHHIVLGILLLLGALYSVYMFLIGIDGLTVLVAYQNLEQVNTSLSLVESLVYLLLLLNCVAIVMALLIIIRPSLLKKPESWSNHWISTEDMLKPLEKAYKEPVHCLPRHPRLFGILLVFGCLYILLNVGSYSI